MKKYVTAFLCVLIVGCGGNRGQVDTAETGEGEAADSDHELILEPEVVEEWGIEVGHVTTTDISSRVTLPGSVRLNQNRTAHISSFAMGKVARISVDLGDRVRTGQVLLTLNSPEFAVAQTTYLEARTRLNLSQREYERATALFEQKAIEEREFIRRVAEHEQNTAEMGAAESALHSFGLKHDRIRALEEDHIRLWKEGGDPDVIADPMLPIISPIGGSVIYRDAILGEQVDPEKDLFIVSDLGTLWAELDAYEKDIPFVNERSEVAILSPLYPGREFPGRITYISDVVDENLRTIAVRVEMGNADGLLKPNMYIDGTIVNRDPGANYLAVPESAIVDYHGEKTVFVTGTHDHEAGAEEEDHIVFEVRHIEIGELIGDLRIVTGGLDARDNVVLTGAFTIKAELEKGSVGAAHVH